MSKKKLNKPLIPRPKPIVQEPVAKVEPVEPWPATPVTVFDMPAPIPKQIPAEPIGFWKKIWSWF